MKKWLGLFVLSVVGLATPALASPITIVLNEPNAAVVGFPAPYGGVVVNLTSPTTATFLFTANEMQPRAYSFGGEDIVAANINVTGTGFSVSLPPTEVPMNGTFTPIFDSQLAPGNVDGMGTFNLRLKNMDGFGDSARTVAFMVTNIGGTWSSSANVLTPNAPGAAGNEVAAHLFVCTVSFALCSATSGAIATGYVADGAGGVINPQCTNPDGSPCTQDATVPEPASLVMLGTGLVGLAAASRRKWLRKV